jgi:hypothetical protein
MERLKKKPFTAIQLNLEANLGNRETILCQSTFLGAFKLPREDPH